MTIIRSLLNWNPAKEASGDSVAVWRGCAHASIVLGVTVGVQGMLGAMFAFGRDWTSGRDAGLTDWGRSLFRPERDLPLYVVGCVVSLGLAWLLVRIWDRRVDRGVFPEGENRTLAGWAVLQLLLAAGASLVFVLVGLRTGRSLAIGAGLRRALGFFLITAPGVIACLWATCVLTLGRGRPRFPSRLVDGWLDLVCLADKGQEPRHSSSPLPAAGGAIAQVAGMLSDLAAVVLIVTVIYSPAWVWLTLRSPDYSERNTPYHHWNAFAMGPAVGFKSGGALGTDVFSQYGVGWPLLFTALDPVLPLSYTNMVGLSVSYCCLYFIGFYLLLRLTLGSASWALAGTVLAFAIQLYRGLPNGAMIWTTPSSTMMRSPLDVWFFLAMLMHLRTCRVVWAALASALAGFAILFEIDSGIYLTVALLIYATLKAGSRFNGIGGGRHEVAKTVLVCCASFVATLLGGLAVASRGTVLGAGFWRGWLEGVVEYGGGMFALPIATAPGGWELLDFCAAVSLFLVLFARALLPPRNADQRNQDLFWGVWSAYGLQFLILFVYRSHSYNIYHVAPPFIAAAVYATFSTAKWAERAIHRLVMPSRWVSFSSVGGYVAIALCLAALVKSPGFRIYPGLLGMALMRPGAGELPSEPKKTSSPRIHQELPIEFGAVVTEMAALRSRGKTVGVLHLADTMLYLHSECPLPFRYSPLMLSSLTIDQLNRNLDAFSRANIDYILIVNEEECEKTGFYMIWRAFRAVLGRDYVFQRTIGSFGLWRRGNIGSRPESTERTERGSLEGRGNPLFQVSASECDAKLVFRVGVKRGNESRAREFLARSAERRCTYRAGAGWTRGTEVRCLQGPKLSDGPSPSLRSHLGCSRSAFCSRFEL
jgi:hypothetical protein